MTTVDSSSLSSILGAYQSDPFSVLGIHPVKFKRKSSLAVRAFLPQAKEVSVKRVEAGNDVLHPMERVHAEGFFEAVFPGETEFFCYQLSIMLHDGRTYVAEDPYRFTPVLTDFDLHLFSE